LKVETKREEKRCLLHIGAPKTGSTALQKFLAGSREALANLGWVYPDVSLRGFGHHDIAFLLGGGYPEWALPQERPLEDLVVELEEAVAGKSKVIISSENFYLLPSPRGTARMLRQAGFGPGEVKVVVYLRRQDEAHMSWYNQVVKAQGYAGTAAACVAETHDLWDYGTRLDAWAEVFGEDCMVVRPYQEGDLREGDVCRDFLHLAGLPEKAFEFPDGAVNTRINRDVLEFQRLVNRLPLEPPERRRFHRELIALTAATAETELFDDSPLLTTEERRKILDGYSGSNGRVARTYLSRERLFPEIGDRMDSGSDGGEGLTTEKLTYILGWILARWPGRDGDQG
jgi:hypothetical protein